MASTITLPLEVNPLHSVTATETAQPFAVLPGPSQGTQTYVRYRLRVQYFDALLTSGSGTLTFSAQVSYDKGGSWVTNASGAALTLSTTSQTGEQELSVLPNQPTMAGEIWLQVIATVGGSPTGASAAYRAVLE